GEHLTGGVGQIAALEMAHCPSFGIERKLERRRRSAQRRVQTLHGTPLCRLGEQLDETGAVRRRRLDEACDGIEAVADVTVGVDEEQAVRNRLEQRGILLLTE